MNGFLMRVLINAFSITITAYFVPGIEVTNDIVPLIIVGIIITVVNALIKPILMALTCPAVILTLGLFILVINGLVLQIAAYMAGDSFVINGFGAAFMGGIIMAIVNMVLEGVMGDKDEKKKVEDK